MTKFDKVIPPGSEGKIYASIDTSHADGEIQKFIDIKSNDPAHPAKRISIKAIIKSLVKVDPDYLRFNVLKGSLESAEVLLTPEPNVKLLKPVVDTDVLSAELRPDQGSTQKLVVTLKRTEVIGSQTIQIKVPTEGPIKQVLVPVVLNVHGPLAVNPSVVSFQINSFPEVVQSATLLELKNEPSSAAAVVEKAPAGKQFQVLSEHEGWYQVIGVAQNEKGNRVGWIPSKGLKAVKPPEFPGPQKVQIQSSVGKPFLVLDLRSTIPSVKVQQTSGPKAGSSFEFTVTLQKKDEHKKGNLQGEIVVQTDNTDQPQIKIPLYLIYT